jgi:tRNA pseudouridine38-40 synthase
VSTVRNIKLIFAFDGTNYCGWQRQRNKVAIQQVVEDAIATMTQSQAKLHGAGRTDAGVHALGMVANFASDTNIPCVGFLKGLNSILPFDIRILDVQDMEPEFHARLSARSKSYVYNICNTPVQLPTKRLYSTHVPGKLDVDVVRSCMACVEGTHDFSSFEGSGSRDPSITEGRGAVRQILNTRVESIEENGQIKITLTGNGFLRHMVRNIVGTAIEAGRGKITAEDFAGILAAKDRNCAGPTAPAHGLFLCEIYY